MTDPITDAELEQLASEYPFYWEYKDRQDRLALIAEVRRLREENALLYDEGQKQVDFNANLAEEIEIAQARVRELEAALEKFVAFGEYGGIDGYYRDLWEESVERARAALGEQK